REDRRPAPGPNCANRAWSAADRPAGFCASGGTGTRRFRPEWSRSADTSGAALLDGVPDQHRDVGSAEALDLADAGGGCDVDLGEIVADHVYADKDHAAFLQRRGDGGAD